MYVSIYVQLIHFHTYQIIYVYTYKTLYVYTLYIYYILTKVHFWFVLILAPNVSKFSFWPFNVWF